MRFRPDKKTRHYPPFRVSICLWQRALWNTRARVNDLPLGLAMGRLNPVLEPHENARPLATEARILIFLPSR
jgi:hypothetical protein